MWKWVGYVNVGWMIELCALCRERASLQSKCKGIKGIMGLGDKMSMLGTTLMCPLWEGLDPQRFWSYTFWYCFTVLCIIVFKKVQNLQCFPIHCSMGAGDEFSNKVAASFLMQWGRVTWSASRPSKNFHQSRPCVTLACADTCWSTAVTYVHLRSMKHMKLWNTSIRHLWVDQQLYQCGSDVWTLSSRLLEHTRAMEPEWIRMVMDT